MLLILALGTLTYGIFTLIRTPSSKSKIKIALSTIFATSLVCLAIYWCCSTHCSVENINTMTFLIKILK